MEYRFLVALEMTVRKNNQNMAQILHKSFRPKGEIFLNMKVNNIGRLYSSNFFVYIMTIYTKTTLYIGVTNNLKRRMIEHEENPIHSIGFTVKYNCLYLVYWERFERMIYAINREKQIKKWRREKKNRLISGFNPEWRFLNEELD